jgi:hypothetical protein
MQGGGRPTRDKLCLESSPRGSLSGDKVVTQGCPGVTALWEETSNPGGDLLSLLHSTRCIQMLGFIWGWTAVATPIVQMGTVRPCRCRWGLLLHHNHPGFLSLGAMPIISLNPMGGAEKPHLRGGCHLPEGRGTEVQLES